MTDEELAKWLDIMAGHNNVEERVLSESASRLRRLAEVERAARAYIDAADSHVPSSAASGPEVIAMLRRVEQTTAELRTALEGGGL